MAKTVGHQSGQLTLANQGLGTLLYTAPSTGVTKIIMCELSAKAQTGFWYSHQNLKLFTKSDTQNGSANIVVQLGSTTDAVHYHKAASFGSGIPNTINRLNAGNYNGGSIAYNNTNTNGYAGKIEAPGYNAYSSYFYNEFYLIPSAKIYGWHDQGNADVLLNYAFITINET